jgi:hypothetical protein
MVERREQHRPLLNVASPARLFSHNSSFADLIMTTTGKPGRFAASVFRPGCARSTTSAPGMHRAQPRRTQNVNTSVISQGVITENSYAAGPEILRGKQRFFWSAARGCVLDRKDDVAVTGGPGTH